MFSYPMLTIALLNTGEGSGPDEGPADCAGLSVGPSDGMFAQEAQN